MRTGLLVCILAVAAAGCATSKLNYTPPVLETVHNQVVVDAPFEEVWDRLVKNLASDFFVINNIEKSSRIINVSFSTNNPSDFVTCGLTSREFSNARGTQQYQYDPASSAQYTFTDVKGMLFNASRTSRLNGRTNVYVAPDDSGGTMVSVNAKYVVDVSLSFTNVYNQPAGAQNVSFDFSTKQPQVKTDGVTCIAKGNIEAKILGYAR